MTTAIDLTGKYRPWYFDIPVYELDCGGSRCNIPKMCERNGIKTIGDFTNYLLSKVSKTIPHNSKELNCSPKPLYYLTYLAEEVGLIFAEDLGSSNQIRSSLLTGHNYWSKQRDVIVKYDLKPIIPLFLKEDLLTSFMTTVSDTMDGRNEMIRDLPQEFIDPHLTQALAEKGFKATGYIKIEKLDNNP